MNCLLELKGRMRPIQNVPTGGGLSFRRDFFLTRDQIHFLKLRLSEVRSYWTKETGIANTLVNVHCVRVIPKSKRLNFIFSEDYKNPNVFIKGAKFEIVKNTDGEPYHRHVFTYYIKRNTIDVAIRILTNAEIAISTFFGGSLNFKSIEDFRNKFARGVPQGFPFPSINQFLRSIYDIDSIADFSVPQNTIEFVEESVISLYDIGVDTKILLRSFGISINDDRVFRNTSVRLTVDEINALQKKAPYLISMGVHDLNSLSRDDFFKQHDISPPDTLSFPNPSNEPTIGVIDTHFDTDAYFSKWVEYKNMLDSNIPISYEDKCHGTAVSSIIVDGPSLNPEIDDGCGRFKVRHFGVAINKGFRSFDIMRNIRKIILANRDIKVWNLSLGSSQEIQKNFISPQAAELDALQYEFDDIIFVVAGTNIPTGKEPPMRLGAPADSLNSIVVNAVNKDSLPASYTRNGPVLSFFRKPDIAYFGGDIGDASNRVRVFNGGLLSVTTMGTSYAAPWISRKVAYLMHIMGLPREIAKALIIDSAARWNDITDCNRLGYGVVPTKIEDILNCPNDEIRFFIYGHAEEYEMRTYELPIPMNKNAFPFFSRATLSYMPYCVREQGVDYTNSEMDIRLGRLAKNSNGDIIVKDIGKNQQGEDNLSSNREENARNIYRKWDNIKRNYEQVKERRIPRKSFGFDKWGLRIITKERTSGGDRNKLAYGVVVTLKEMHGQNRFAAFEDACASIGWIVNRIDIENRVKIHEMAEQDIHLE